MNEVLRDIKHIIDKAEPCDIDPLSAKTFEEQKERLKAVKDYPIEPKWIPCSERLPELSKYVLATYKCGNDFKGVGIFSREWVSDNNSGMWCSDDGYGQLYDYDVVAWMPLPEPWKVQSTEDNSDSENAKYSLQDCQWR